MKCTNHLMRDHKIILRSLNVLQSMANEEIGNGIDADDAAVLLRFLEAFADEHHHIKEESMLYPELIRAGNAHASLQHLLFEHDQERSLVGGLADALHCKKKMDFVVFANRLAARIRNHIEKEDRMLFPILEDLISQDEDERVSAEFDKVQLDPGLLADLRQLEWKYLRRTANSAGSGL